MAPSGSTAVRHPYTSMPTACGAATSAKSITSSSANDYTMSVSTIYCPYHTPDGFDDLVMCSDGDVLTGLFFEGSRDSSKGGSQQWLPVFGDASRWLDAYFSGRQPDFTPAFRIDGATPFRQAVLELVRAIPFGEVRTYGGLADMLASRGGSGKMSAQAVGGAVGWNPLCIIIPCHRVVGRGNSLVGYGGGLHNKASLLRLEQKQGNI